MVFSPKSSAPVRNHSYYTVHQYEAYLDGYTNLLGDVTNMDVPMKAYVYFLPQEVAHLIPRLTTYFHNLIEAGPKEKDAQRRKSLWEAVTVAVNMVVRTNYIISHGENGTIAIGSNHIKPVTWAIIGAADSAVKMYSYRFSTLRSLIDHYTKRYENPCHCYPACIYQSENSRSELNAIVGECGKSKPLNMNMVMAASIHYLADLIEHCGPDVTEFFDLFTNDLKCHPDRVDIELWKDCRAKALNFKQPAGKERGTIGFASTMTPTPPPKPQKITVKVREEKIVSLNSLSSTCFWNCPKTKNEEEYYNRCFMYD